MELLAAPNPKLKDSPLAAVHDYLFFVFTASLSVWSHLLYLLSEDICCDDKGFM
jgi:hypothetical protein